MTVSPTNGTPSTWIGEYMDGVSAAVHPVTIEDGPDWLVIRHRDTGEELARWSIRAARLDALAEGGSYHIQHADHDAALLTTSAPELAESLRPRVTRHLGIPGGSRRWR